MTGLTVVFEPLIAPALIALLSVVAIVTGLIALRRRVILRVFAVAALAAALTNPSLVREEREPLPDVVVLAVDQSESMILGERTEAAEAASESVRSMVAADESLELIEAAVPRGDDGTRLFETVSAALAEAPRGRLAGVVVVTDGRVHDAPSSADALDIDAPLHALLIGDQEARDRRLEIVRAPQFGIVGQTVTFAVRVEDSGAADGTPVEVRFSVDGGDPLTARARVGATIDVGLELRRRGPNVVEIEAAPAFEELTTVNNSAAVSVVGVRDRLKVLLVTGEPHAGARAWRDLLKSDPSVDLVHFTILRPPTKNDGTPTSELSLIAFPTRELFERKLDDFDLVIFDQYRRRGVLNMLYLDNIARFVEDGGALLIAAGPHFASPDSLHRTPLSAVLPARPTFDGLNGVVAEGFRPHIAEAGERHPVTAPFALDGQDEDWGRWFRIIDTAPVSGDAVLTGPDERPLLMLDRVGDGRVALLLSDQAWLWSRGVEGGGPYGELFRRLAHWLMQEPELEEERLTADISDGLVRLTRRTMGDAPENAVVIAPSGQEIEAQLLSTEPGLFVGEAAVEETGLHRIRSGDLTAVAAAGPLNPTEFLEVLPSAEALEPIVDATDGGSYFVGSGARPDLPQVRRTRPAGAQAGRDWMGLKRNNAYAARAFERTPLAPALAAMGLILFLTTLAWAREGK